MCKLIQRGSVLCMSALLTVVVGMASAQGGTLEMSPQGCYTETRTTKKCWEDDNGKKTCVTVTIEIRQCD